MDNYELSLLSSWLGGHLSTRPPERWKGFGAGLCLGEPEPPGPPRPHRLALYVYEYLLHIGAQKSAQTFLSEVSRCLQPGPPSPPTPQGPPPFPLGIQGMGPHCHSDGPGN